jgi:hypothetical protein
MKLKRAVGLLPFILLAASLGACTPKPPAENGYADEKVNVDMIASPPVVQPRATPPAVNALPQLAYEYNYTFTASAKGVETLVTADQTACAKAGPAVCQVISMNTQNNSDAGTISKTLELRVTPEWLKTWHGGLNAGLAKAHGHIAEESVTSEDLSLEIVDTDARLKNKLALRDRLLDIIKHNAGKIGDLVEAETQLSQVQSDIDSAQSSLAVMQKRVATSHLTLSYNSEMATTSRGTFEPVISASKNILNNIMTMIGGIITVGSLLLPLGLVLAPVIWFGLKWWRNRKPKIKPTPQP